MIHTEFFRVREDGVRLHRTYSDLGCMIRQVGSDDLYEEAIDPDGYGRTYEETNIYPDDDGVLYEISSIRVAGEDDNGDGEES